MFGDQRAGGGDLNSNTILANRVRLNFDSSFTGKDRLRVRLQSGNVTGLNPGVTGTNMTRLGFDTKRFTYGFTAKTQVIDGFVEVESTRRA
ncbi:hypothetical protein IQ240_08910 [Nodularia sp. LEGE 04288]|nr:hypothetical protein [Nodularia sp. LEGE 04288]